MMSAALRIYLLGGFRLQQGGTPLPPIPTQKARSLLAYLLTYRDQPHTRDLLAGLFWPDLPDARARRRLSQALWQVRRVLETTAAPEPYLVSDAHTVQFNTAMPYWLDVAAFEQGVQAIADGSDAQAVKALRMAVELYRGDFLSGFYDEWIAVERERLRELYLSALERLVRLCKAQGTFEEALAYARQLTLYDPLREEAHREVMRLCHHLGRTNEALRQYELCRTVLQEELGVEPAPATTALYHEIAAHARVTNVLHLPHVVHAPPSPLLEGPGALPLVGRERERAILVALVERTIEGRGGLVLLEGEAGVGKTRLLQEVARDATWREVQVLWGRGRELAEMPPYGVLREALEAGMSPLRAEQLAQQVEGIWLREISLILPRLTEWLPNLPPHVSLKPQEEPQRLLEALTRTVPALGQIAPHLLILDDLQWADEATLEALIHLAPRLRESRVLIIGSYRREEARERAAMWGALRTLDRVSGHERLQLKPLTAAEVAELVRQGLGLTRAAPRFEARIYHEVGGNPLFVLETLRALHDQGLLYRDAKGVWSTPWDDHTADYTELPLSPKLHRVIADRLAHLSPTARTVLNTAAVLGREFGPSLLAEAIGMKSATLLTTIGELLRKGLFVEEGQGFRFSHDKVRQVAYAELTDAERRRLHRRIARALEAHHPEDVEALAFHFERAQEWKKAVRYYQQAGQRATMVHAYAMARAHYDRAIELVDVADLPPDQRFTLLAAREATLDILGERDAQAADLAAMERLAQGDPRRLAEVRRRQIWLLAHLGRFDEAEATAREALGLAETLGDVEGRAAVLVALGTALNWRWDSTRAISYLEQAVAIYRQRSDPQREAEARLQLGNALSGVGRYDAAQAEEETALRLYEQIGDKRGQAEALSLLGIIHMEQGETEAAHTCYRRGLDLCRAIGYRLGEARNLSNLGNLFFVEGRVRQALDCYEEAIHIFETIGVRRGKAQTQINRASVRCTVLGDMDAAVADVEAAMAYFRAVNDPGGQGQCFEVRAAIALQKGMLAEARSYIQASLEALRAAHSPWLEVQVRRLQAVLALKEGDPERASRLLEETERICRELGMRDLAISLLALRGKALLDLGEPQAALAATTEAMAQLRPGVVEAYLVPFWHYQVLTALGQEKEARAALERAYHTLLRFLDGFPPAEQRRSIQHVPEHREIVAAWQATQPPRTTFRLPRADAPTGRPLRDDEWVEVMWTLDAPEDTSIPRKTARRQHRLLRLVREAAEQGAAPTVDHLAAALGVSRATIKRDLAALRKAGYEVRTRGSRG
jgi:DNA-binding SARP family transcriptional activator/DNA-binding transcriptional ArsR family regulator